MTRFSPHRLFWWVYARIYDQLWDTPHLGNICAQVDSMLPSGAPAIEVGAGTGIVTAHLLRSGRAMVVCEPNPAMADRFARRNPGVALTRAELADLESVPAFDVVAVNVLHLIDDPIGGLRRLRQLCGPDHVVVVVTPDPTVGLLDVAAAQRRAGVHPLRVARFLLWHMLLAPLSVLCGMSSRIRLDWYRGIEAQFGGPRPVGDTHLMLVLPGLDEPPFLAEQSDPQDEPQERRRKDVYS